VQFGKPYKVSEVILEPIPKSHNKAAMRQFLIEKEWCLGGWDLARIESLQKQQKLIIHGSIACKTKQMNDVIFFFWGGGGGGGVSQRKKKHK
jgi:hypothetical protein